MVIWNALGLVDITMVYQNAVAVYHLKESGHAHADLDELANAVADLGNLAFGG